MLFSHCPFCSMFLSLSHCLWLWLTISASLSLTLCFVSVSETSQSLSVSDSLSISVSSPGLARPLGHGVTGRQGTLCLFSALAGRGPSWDAVQESSSCPAPATRHSHWPLPAHSVPSREPWGWGGSGGFLSGSSYRTARPGGLAPHQCGPLMPPLPTLGLDLPEWGPSASSSLPQGLCTCSAFYLELPLPRYARDLLPGRLQVTDHLLRTSSLSLGQNAPPFPYSCPDAFCFPIFPLSRSSIFTCLLAGCLLPQSRATSPALGAH